MNDQTASVLVASVVGGLAAAMWHRTGPLRLLSRAVDHIRAAFFLVGVLAGVCWRHRYRWHDCLERARRER